MKFVHTFVIRFFAPIVGLAMLSLLAVLASGCITGAGYTTRDRVLVAARDYNDGVRWGRFEQASQHIPANVRKRFVERHSALEDELEIADYELVSVDIDKKADKVVARIDYTWSLKRRGLVEKTSTDQTWENKDSEWFLVKEVRVKGAPLVIFDESKKD